MNNGLIAKISTKAIKHAPKICLGAGIIIASVGTVIACKKTHENYEKIETAKEIKDVFINHADNKKEVIKAYASYSKKLVSIYYIPIGTVTTGLCLIVFGNKILNKRYIGLIAAYTSLDTSFKQYRGRVREKYGREEDILMLTNGEYAASIDNLGKGEMKVCIDPDELIIPDRDISNGYFFMEGCPEWTKDPERNKEFLENMEQEANRILERQGYIFLNDVLAMVGIGPTSAGGEIGWVHGRGDDFVSFGIYEAINRRAINGWEPVYILDFNHDGYILPYI